MLTTVKKTWRFISYLGIDHNEQSNQEQELIRVFFNRCLFIGFFSLIFQISASYAFIGNFSFLGIISALAIVFALFIHAKGHYAIAKRVAVYGVFMVGMILTALSGGDFLFHTGVITILTFSWILFDFRTERFELFLFLLFTCFTYYFGEFNPFHAPDFTGHTATQMTRLTGLISYTSLVSLFIYFIKNLNASFRIKLSKAAIEKEDLLKILMLKSEMLEGERNDLEKIVLKRTEELREKSDVLEIQNKEKEILLKEVHHRVKNNLQIIVSLLNLQASNVQDVSLVNSIHEMQNRIITMSLVHQRIYQHSSFDAIQFKDYIDLLYQNSGAVFIDRKLKITYSNTTATEIKIDIDTAIPLGLIINELLTNTFKHAFTDKAEEYHLTIFLEAHSDTIFKLHYSDTGPGLPADFSIEKSSTLGLQLIDGLAAQINGELNYYNKNGAVFEIIFKGNGMVEK